MKTSTMNFQRHLTLASREEPALAGPLGALLAQIAFVGKTLSREIGRSALSGQLGYAGGGANATGDVQKKLDVSSNEILLEGIAGLGLVAAVASEELDEIHFFADGAGSPFILVTDPLDGSSNTDNDGAVGTIFGIYRVPNHTTLNAGSILDLVSTEPPVAAGYVLYGPSTLFVYTAGQGVHGFTLDREIGEFLLTHANIRCPKKGRIYSANVARAGEWSPALQDFLGYITQRDAATQRPYSLRYAGALVADLHRALIEGGLYLYPADAGHARGKLRQVYECAPLAFVVENAGGRASNGSGRVLDARVDALHQRTPLYIGSAQDVALCERFLSGQPIAIEETIPS